MKRALVTAVASLALLAVAAGGASAAPAKHAKTQSNIVQVASSNGQFTTLVSLVKKAGLAGALSGKGPYTVFAPTDAAFAKVPKATLTALLKDKAKLKAVLLYHVVAGKVPAAEALKLAGKGVKTVNGAEAKIMVMDGKPMINQAHIVKTDIMAKNGVIHVIDAVILPPAK